MRTSYTLGYLAFEEVRITFAPYKASSILIYRVIHVNITQIRHRKKTWNVCIIHEETVSEAVNLEGVDSTEFRMVVSCMLLECFLNLVCQFQTLACEIIASVHFCKDFRCLSERSYCEEVGRYEELKGCRIVRRTERRHDKTNRIHRSTVSVIAERVKRTACMTHECVRTHTILPLLLTEGLENILHCSDPKVRKDGRVSGNLPVFICKTDRIAV